MKKNYYGLAGVNAYGVYTNYDKVLTSRKYIKGYKIKGFSSFAEAANFAKKTFTDLQNGYIDISLLKEIDRANWCYFYRK